MTVKSSVANRLKLLREQGYTIREIANQTGVPSATVHRYTRNISVNGHHHIGKPKKPSSSRKKRDHGFPKLEGRYIGIEKGRRYRALYIHLPDTVICPECDLETQHVVICLDCGQCWIGECGHGGDVGGRKHRGVNLAELRRGKNGDGSLHVHPVTLQG